MVNYKKMFPLKHAKGKAFCNRVSESAKLLNDLQSGQHVLIVSPRRYGKSSLVLFTAEKYKLICERIDLFIAIDQKSIESLVLKGCKNLINRLLSPTDRALKIIKDYLKQIKLKWIVGTDGINIEIIPEKGIDPVTSLLETLKLVEAVLQKLDKPAILFIDEFQEVGKLSEGRGLEGAIRHVAEQTEKLTFIFSGSSRHLLTQMFEDRNRPLYNLCERITLPRISSKDYAIFINKYAIKTWSKSLSKNVFDTIFELTDRHPYYMNVLCRRIWGESIKHAPTSEFVRKQWNDYAEQEISKTSKDLSMLGTSQIKILTVIANNIKVKLTSKYIQQSLNLSSSGIVKAIKVLMEKDFIERRNNSYEIIDPLIKWSLKHFYSDYLKK